MRLPPLQRLAERATGAHGERLVDQILMATGFRMHSSTAIRSAPPIVSRLHYMTSCTDHGYAAASFLFLEDALLPRGAGPVCPLWLPLSTLSVQHAMHSSDIEYGGTTIDSHMYP